MAENEEEHKSLLRVKEESEKPAQNSIFKKIKMWHQLHQFMANRREKVEVVTDFIFLGSKITADGDCGHEIRRRLLLGRKVTTNKQHIKKQGLYFANKGPSSQSYGFSSSYEWTL